MDKQPILSICIPTNGVVEWVIPVVNSIYAQGVDNSLFEVVITDNGGKDILGNTLAQYDYPNIRYFKTTSQGFINQVDAFEKCSGLFCKMLNHRSRMIPGSIDALIDLVRRYEDDKPIIYCAEGNAKGGEIIECANIDEFVCSLSYWVSWSAGTGAWKTDLTDLREKISNKMFPHMLFLFGLRENSKYVIWNANYEIMADDAGKGGYDLFYTFGVTLLDILTDLRVNESITTETFILVKNDLYKFLCRLYLNEILLPTKHTFILQNIKESISVYYGGYYYLKMILHCIIRLPWNYFRFFALKLTGRL